MMNHPHPLKTIPVHYYSGESELGGLVQEEVSSVLLAVEPSKIIFLL